MRERLHSALARIFDHPAIQSIQCQIERINDVLERYIALELLLGLCIACAVPVLPVWMIEQKQSLRAGDWQFIIIGDVLLYLAWAALLVFSAIWRRRHPEICAEIEETGGSWLGEQ
jgi:hypothetical protein